MLAAAAHSRASGSPLDRCNPSAFAGCAQTPLACFQGRPSPGVVYAPADATSHAALRGELSSHLAQFEPHSFSCVRVSLSMKQSVYEQFTVDSVPCRTESAIGSMESSLKAGCKQQSTWSHTSVTVVTNQDDGTGFDQQQPCVR